MINKLNIGIRPSSSSGIFHDSREDVRRLGKALNITIDKINELVEVVNRQDKIIKGFKESVEDKATVPSPPEGPPLRTVRWDETVRGIRGW